MNDVDQAAGEPHGQPPAKKSGAGVVVVLVVGVMLVWIVVIVGALGFFGVRRYLQQSKAAEARNKLPVMAQGIADCGAPLPPSSTAIPPTPPQGTKYASTEVDWAQPAFSCGSGTSISLPQYFSYQWERSSDTEGSLIAVADLDGDGHGECRFEVSVFCPSSPSGVCAAGAVSGGCED